MRPKNNSVPITLKYKWTIAARLAFLDVPTLEILDERFLNKPGFAIEQCKSLNHKMADLLHVPEKKS